MGCSPFSDYSDLRFSLLVKPSDYGLVDVVNSEISPTKQQSAIISFSNVKSGRIWKFDFTEDGQNKLDLSCQAVVANQSFFYLQLMNSLILDVNSQEITTEFNFVCEDSVKQFILKLNTENSRLNVISSIVNAAEIYHSTASSNPAYSIDGSKIAYTSAGQIIVKNLITKNIIIASSIDGTSATQGNDVSDMARFSSDGKKVVFQSKATNFGVLSNGFNQIYIKDLDNQNLTIVSTADNDSNTIGNNDSTLPSFNNDDTLVVFQSKATNLTSSGNAYSQIYTKTLSSNATVLISMDSVIGNNTSGSPEFSPDGSKIAFQSFASNLMAGCSGGQIYEKDILLNTIRLISSSDGQCVNKGNDKSRLPRYSPDGQKIGFYSWASNLKPACSGIQLYYKNKVDESIDIISTNDNSCIGKGNGLSSLFRFCSQDRVTFYSESSNLVPGVSGQQIYLKKINGSIVVLSSNDAVTYGNGNSYSPDVVNDCSRTVFQSTSSNFFNTVNGQQIYENDYTHGL